MKIAVMQPYFLPYIGYFQLINEAEIFVIYNDVNFIERGWINRNNFLINKASKLLSVPLVKASTTSRINSIDVAYTDRSLANFLKTISLNYSSKPYFNVVFPILEESFLKNSNRTIDLFCLDLIKAVCTYLEIKTKFILSSDVEYDHSLDKVGKLINIATIFNADTLLFPKGSLSLYQNSDFSTKGIDGKVVSPDDMIYNQGQREFVPNLSMLDVIMHNSAVEVKKMLSHFTYLNLP